MFTKAIIRNYWHYHATALSGGGYQAVAHCDTELQYTSSVFVMSYLLLSGVPDYFDRNKISSGGDLSHYSSASLY